MVLPADRASRHGRLAPSRAPRENWKALGHGLRLRRNFKWAPKTGAPPANPYLYAPSFHFPERNGRAHPHVVFDLQRGYVISSRRANCEILFAVTAR